MRINEVLAEFGQGAYAGATVGQAMKLGALKALGLGNTADQFSKKHAIGGYAGSNASEIIKQLGQLDKKPITAPSDFYVNPTTKIKITKVDNTGLHYTDPNTGLDSILGPTALQQIYQQRAALQGAMASMQNKPGQPAQQAQTQAAGTPKVV